MEYSAISAVTTDTSLTWAKATAHVSDGTQKSLIKASLSELKYARIRAVTIKIW